MRLRLALPFLVAATFLLPACDNNTNSVTTPTLSTGFTGVWQGTSSDSTGSTLGSGVASGSANMTWTLTQNGTSVTGTLAFVGLTGGLNQSAPTISGTVTGNTMSFLVTIPAGSVASFPLCSATANGTMTLNAAGNQMTGTYTGTGSCTGGFSNGQITLTRQ